MRAAEMACSEGVARVHAQDEAELEVRSAGRGNGHRLDRRPVPDSLRFDGAFTRKDVRNGERAAGIRERSVLRSADEDGCARDRVSRAALYHPPPTVPYPTAGTGLAAIRTPAAMIRIEPASPGRDPSLVLIPDRAF